MEKWIRRENRLEREKWGRIERYLYLACIIA